MRTDPRKSVRSWAGRLVFACAALAGTLAARGESPVEFLVGDTTAAEGGSWSPEASPLREPFGIDFAGDGDMLIAELAGGRVLRLPPGGTPAVIAGDGTKAYSGDGGLAAAARFNGMHNGVITADDELLIADSWNHCVRRIRLATGQVDTLAGLGTKGFSGDGGPAKAAQFDYVMCIALNPARTILHIADTNNRRARNIDLATGTVTTAAGNGSKGVPADGARAAESPLLDPRAVASDSEGNLYILERGGHALRVVRPDGTIHTVAGTGKKGYLDGPARFAEFASPKHLCCDPSGNVYVADDLNAAIRRYDPRSGQVTTLLGSGHGDARIQLAHPHGVRWHEAFLYVVDSGNNRILRVPAAASTPQPSADLGLLELDNGTVRIGIDRRRGAAITWLSWAGYPHNAVNSCDPGRLIQQSYYAGQRLDRRGEGQSGAWSPWCWNPIQGGGVSSWARVNEFKRLAAPSLYAETVPKLWDMPDEEAAAAMRQWTSLEPEMPNVAAVRCEFLARRDENDRWGSAEFSPQEIPACYFTRNFDSVKSYLGDGNWRSESQPPGPPWGQTVPPRQAMALFEASGQGVAVFSPAATQPWNFGPHGHGNSDDPAAGPCMHVAPIDRVSMGPRSVYRYRYWLVVGDAAQLASRLDQLWAAHAEERAELIPQAADP